MVTQSFAVQGEGSSSLADMNEMTVHPKNKGW